MAYGLGSPQMSQAAYGTPISQTMQAAQNFKTGLGRQQDEQRARVQQQQMQALWQQSGGDWQKFKAAGGQQFLSPELVQKMDAQAEAKRVQQEQFDAQMLGRGLDRAATVANQEATREDTSVWRQKQEDRWNEDRTSRGVEKIADRNLRAEQLRILEEHYGRADDAALKKATEDKTPASVKTIKYKVGEYMRLSPNMSEREAFERTLNDESDPYVSKALQMAMLDNKFFNLGMEEKIAYVIDGADVLRAASAESRSGGSGTSTNWQDYR